MEPKPTELPIAHPMDNIKMAGDILNMAAQKDEYANCDLQLCNLRAVLGSWFNIFTAVNIPLVKFK